MEFITNNPDETYKMGQEVGNSLKGAEILALVGELGTGKTTFIQGLAQSLGIKNRIVSPTFILMRTYPLKSKKDFYHLDLYRLEGDIKTQVENLGVMDVWGKENSIVVIEWADKLKDIYPQNTKWIYFENLGENKRKIVIK